MFILFIMIVQLTVAQLSTMPEPSDLENVVNSKGKPIVESTIEIADMHTKCAGSTFHGMMTEGAGHHHNPWTEC